MPAKVRMQRLFRGRAYIDVFLGVEFLKDGVFGGNELAGAD
jgi:hypothetical protein